MAKLTVRDIESTVRGLRRLERYASRHMDNLDVAEVNENIEEARRLLTDNLTVFLDMDVRDMNRDTSDLDKRLADLEENLDYHTRELGEQMARKKKRRDSWSVEYHRERIESINEEMDRINETLSEW